jgi:hypothetical protein
LVYHVDLSVTTEAHIIIDTQPPTGWPIAKPPFVKSVDGMFLVVRLLHKLEDVLSKAWMELDSF